jgi:hypothetical protein
MPAKIPLPLPHYLDALDVDWNALEARLGKTLRRAFAQAAMEAVVESMRRHLVLLPGTQQEIAEKVNVGRTSITHFLAGGGITLHHFLLLATEYDLDINEICPETERAVAGYLEVMPIVRREAFGRPMREAVLDRERFYSLCYLWASRRWKDAVMTGDAEVREQAAREIRRRLREEAGIETGASFGVARLAQVMSDWGPSWIVCLRLIPHRWAFETELHS